MEECSMGEGCRGELLLVCMFYLWHSVDDGGKMLSLRENTCDCSYLLGNAWPPLPSSAGLW